MMRPLSDESGTPLIAGVHHHGVTVSDLDRALRFYHDVLGLEFFTEPSPVFGGPELAQGAGVPGASLRTACLLAGDDIVELIEYVTPPAANQVPHPQNSLGAQHIALRVTNVHAAAERLRTAGVPFLSEPNTVDEGVLAGWRWVYFTDPDGISVELVEVAYERPPEERRNAIAEYLATRPSAQSRSDKPKCRPPHSSRKWGEDRSDRSRRSRFWSPPDAGTRLMETSRRIRGRSAAR